jgi:peptidoglycan/LPS O-acetylase OafA/YrhL
MNAESSRHHTEFLERRYFGSLDGLRCLSIVGVIWHHGPGLASGSMLGRSGQSGVDLFFAISGFLITSLLLRERSSTGRISLLKFYARRSLRIFPLYFTILGVYAVLTLGFGGQSAREQAFAAHLPAFLSYTANWFVPRTSTFGFVWSLSTEEQFYSVWPSFEVFFRRAAIWIMSAVILFSVAVRLQWLQIFATTSLAHKVIVEISLPICLGVLLAHALHSTRGFRTLAGVFAWRGAGLASLALVLILLGTGAPLPLSQAAMVLIVAGCVVREDHWLAPVLRQPLVRHTGVVSYGMYLLHGLVYNGVEGIPGVPVHSLTQFVIALATTTLVATLSYRYYESWFLRLKRRFGFEGSRPAPSPGLAGFEEALPPQGPGSGR